MAKKTKAKAKARPKKKANGIDIGASVRFFRQQMGASTTVIAKKAGISQAQMSRLENNQQGFRSGTLIKIAKALKIRPWALFMTEVERAAASKAIGLGA
jgi:transcriptional regulator with XRE-family HTH domain